MEHQLIIAGFGGQGILFAGKIIAYAAMLENKNVSWIPSYGPEMRGGTANCNVIISDTSIGSPVIRKADTIIVMNNPSFDKFEGVLSSGGTAIVESALIDRKVTRDDVSAVYIPASNIAEELGNRNLGNMVAVGLFAKLTQVVSIDSLIKAMKDNVSKTKLALMEINEKMLIAGYEYEMPKG